MTATYTKLKDGSWGIRVVGKVTTGQTVTVTKKSGESKQETVGKVLWTGDGITLATVSGSPSSPSAPSRLNRYSRRRSSSLYCGGECPVSGLRCCSENGPCHDCQ